MNYWTNRPVYIIPIWIHFKLNPNMAMKIYISKKKWQFEFAVHTQRLRGVAIFIIISTVLYIESLVLIKWHKCYPCLSSWLFAYIFVCLAHFICQFPKQICEVSSKKSRTFLPSPWLYVVGSWIYQPWYFDLMLALHVSLTFYMRMLSAVTTNLKLKISLPYLDSDERYFQLGTKYSLIG